MAVTNQYPRLAGSVSGVLSGDGRHPEVVATLAVDRGLRGGKLDVVELDEHGVARLVADGAAVLVRLAKERHRG